MLSKKAIGPVVAMSLLLVIGVTAVVAFESWFSSYSSALYVGVENKAAPNSISKIERVIENTLYFNVGNNNNITITRVVINGVSCNVSDTYMSGIQKINVSLCNSNNTQTSSSEVVVYTNEGVFSQKFFSSSNSLNSSGSSSPSLSCSTLDYGEWLLVPGNSGLGTDDFCVMKYEAKEDSSGECLGGDSTNCPVSQPQNQPWIELTWQEAKTECNDLGEGYNLITEPQWLTIAKEIESNSQNWNSSIVGTGGVFRGNVNLNDALSCGSNSILDANTNGTNCIVDTRNKRTHYIDGELIWDFSGNVWEWVNQSVFANSGIGSPYRYHGGNQQWMSYNVDDGPGNVASLVPSSKLPSNNWNADQGMGRYYDGFSSGGAYNNINEEPDNCTGACSETAVFLRGGKWSDNTNAGIFTLSLNLGPSYDNTDARPGFRCTYTS